MLDQEAHFMFRFDSGPEAKKMVGKVKEQKLFPEKMDGLSLGSSCDRPGPRETEEPPRGGLT